MKPHLIFLLLFVFSCAKQESILICGDHQCINKAEAKQYFEENLTLEVQIISNDKKLSYDLVDLNLNNEKKQSIRLFKNKKRTKIKKLSTEEIKKKKVELKKKKSKSNSKIKTASKNLDINKNNKQKIISTYTYKNNSIDICIKLNKCDIDSITNYLIKYSIEKDFPNIALKE